MATLGYSFIAGSHVVRLDVAVLAALHLFLIELLDSSFASHVPVDIENVNELGGRSTEEVKLWKQFA